MAGGYSGKADPKKLQLIKNNSSEVLKDSQTDHSPPPPVKFSLKGILGLGQTIEFDKPVHKSQEIYAGLSHIQHETNILFNQHQKELETALKELREEIAKLASVTDNLEKDVEIAALAEIPDANEYQINFFVRVRNFIANVRESISETSIWVQAFAAKKKKRNYFWNTANNKKKGGTQFMFSDESSVARSVG